MTTTLQTNESAIIRERNSKLGERLLFTGELLWLLICSVPINLYVFVRKFFPRQGKDVKNKIVLITGTGSGIGKNLAIQFSKHGSIVICVDVNKNDNEKTVEEIISRTGNSKGAKSIICDVSDTEAIKKLRDDVLKEYGHVDILVNNAGLVYGNTILSGDDKMIRRVIDVNLLSVYWMVRAFLPHMKERGDGQLVFMNSISSVFGIGDASIYSVAKAGLYGLLMSLLEEFNRDPECANIKLTSVHPYFIGTKGFYDSDDRSKRISAMKPEKAAKIILRGIQREYFQFTVPGYETGYWLISAVKLLPIEIYKMLATILYRNVLRGEKVKSH